MAERGMWGMLLVPAFVGAVACSGDSDGIASNVSGDGQGIAQLLTALPAPGESDAPLIVAYGDLSQAAEIAGVERPSDSDDDEAVRRYVNALSGIRADDGDDEHPPSVAVAWPGVANVPEGALRMDEFVEDVGWTILEVDRFIARETPPEDITVLDGRFDRRNLDEAMGEAEDGVWVAGEPGELGETTSARRAGQPLWLSLDGDTLLVAGSTEAMEATRRDGGPEETLADDATLGALGRALDGEDVYTALLDGDPPSLTESLPDFPSEQVDEICDQALAAVPRGVGAGLADDDGPVVVLAFVHDSESDAQSNAEAVERTVEEGRSAVRNEPWSEDLTIDRVTVDGEVTVARLRPAEGTHVRIWQDILLNRDSLVTAC